MMSGLRKVQDTLAVQLEDPEMLKKIIDVVVGLVDNKVKVKDDIAVVRWKYGCMGVHLEHAAAKYSYNKRFCQAVQALTTPEKLAKLNRLDGGSPLDNSWLFDQIRVADEKAMMALDGQDYGVSYDYGDTGAQDAPGDDEAAGGEVGISSEFEQHRRSMLGFLEPVFDFVDNLPMSIETPTRTSADGDDPGPEIEKASLKHRVGGAGMVIKVHNPRFKTTPKRVAFIGPESVGKSTLINHLTSNGEGTKFMPESAGMGTQMMCIVSDGPHEALFVGQTAVHGNVLKTLAKESEARAKGTSSIASMEVVQAMKPFDPPIPLDLIDVPGIKKGKELETVLALSISSVLSLCLGPCDKAKASLTQASGSLSALPSIYHQLPEPIPIVCIVTRVKKAQYREEDYVRLVREVFRDVNHVSVVWANFHEMGGVEEKVNSVNSIYKAFARYPTKDLEPYSAFLKAHVPVSGMMKKAWGTMMKHLSQPYFRKFDIELDALPEKVSEVRKATDLEAIKQMMARIPIEKALKVEPKGMPVFSVIAQDITLSTVPDEVLIAQEILLEVRLKIVKWLFDQGAQLHSKSIGRIFGSIAGLVVPAAFERLDAREFAQKTVCDRFVRTIQSVKWESQNEDDPSKDPEMWKKSTENKVVQLMVAENFPWVIVGYYLLTVDDIIVAEMLERFCGDPKSKAVVTSERWIHKWNQDIVKVVEKELDYMKWVKKCKALEGSKTGPRVLYEMIFECMVDSCRQYDGVIKRLKVIKDWNACIKALLGISCSVLQKLMVRKRVRGTSYQEGLEFTAFAEHLRKHTRDIEDLERTVDDLSTAAPDRIQGLSAKVVELMRSQGKNGMSEQWVEVLDKMQKSVDEMAVFSKGLGPVGQSTFDQGPTPRVMILTGPAEDDEDMVPAGVAQWEFQDQTWLKFDLNQSELLERASQNKQGTIYTCLPKKGADIFEVSGAEALLQTKQQGSMVWEYTIVDENGQQRNMKTSKSRKIRKSAPFVPPKRASSQGGLASALASNTSPRVLSSLQKVQKANTTSVHLFQNKTVDSISYKDAVMKEVRAKGTSLVIMVRPSECFTHDPLGLEIPLLQALSREPHVSDIFVLWGQEGDENTWPSAATQERWEKKFPSVKLHLASIKGARQEDDLVNQLDMAMQESRDCVKKKIADQTRSLESKKESCVGQARRFMDNLGQGSKKDANWFQQELLAVKRHTESTVFQSQLSAQDLEEPMTVPKLDQILQDPNSIRQAESVRDYQHGPLSINELPFRALLVNIMLGQTIDRAAALADNAYELFMVPFFDKIGGWFCMSGAALREELERFIKQSKDNQLEEKDLAGFVSREHFKQMYVGCVLWSAVPLVYCLILPTLWDSTQGSVGKVSHLMYEQNVKKAVCILKKAATP